ncbi:hypothetical protein DFH06DRAFT_1239287 [Mycena polygramma]|nr:hypothetical protein DFH06DRAFT_1239287 [Mycena polygramma]
MTRRSFSALPIHFAVDVDHSYWFCTTCDTSTAVFPHLPCRHRAVPGRFGFCRRSPKLCLQIRLLLFTSAVYLAVVSEYLTSFISRATPCASISTVPSCMFCRSSSSTTWSRACSPGRVVLSLISIPRCRQPGKRTGPARAESHDVTKLQISYRTVCIHHCSARRHSSVTRSAYIDDWVALDEQPALRLVGAAVYYWWTDVD